MLIGEVVGAHAGLRLGNLQLHTLTLVAVAMGQADHTRHHVLAGLHLDFKVPGTRADTNPLAVLQLPLLQVLRVHQQLMSRFAFHQPMKIVHPRIVAAYMATADQQ
ncbi:hypothetical protein D3C71_1773540 [compost metagenome]